MELKTASPEQPVANKIEIAKAKLTKDLTLEVVYNEQTNEGPITHSVTGSAKVHDDLRIAMKDLVPHIANMCDQYNKEGQPDIEKIVCRGVTITDGKNPGYILTGVRELQSGKKITLNTPLLSVETSDEVYPDIDDLREGILTVGGEVRLYLFAGKKAADSQLELELDGEDEDN